MASGLDDLRYARRLAATVDGFARVHLLRTGIHLGLFEALRTPQTEADLAERLGLARDLVAAWLHAVHAQGLIRLREGQYRIGGFVRWLLEAPQAHALHALLDQAAVGYGPRLESLQELMKGGERPEFGESGEALRVAAVSRLVEDRALQALGRIPGARSARRVLDVGCGFGSYLAGLLRRYRDAQGLGIEIDPNVAEEGRRTLREAEVSRRAEIRVGDFMTMDLPRGNYDLILVNHGLHHFSAPERVALFRRAFGRLSDVGVLAVQTAVVREGTLARWLGGASPVATLDLFFRMHRNLHGLPELEELRTALAEVGFTETGVVSIVPGGSVAYVWGRS